MNSVNPQISVIVITKNQKKYLEKTLHVLSTQTISSYEVIIVDSGSEKECLGLYRRYPVKVISIQPKTFNYAAALSRGIEVASAPIVLRLSGDAVPQNPDFLERFVTHFEDPTVAGVNLRWLYSKEKMIDEYQLTMQFYENMHTATKIRNPFPPNAACIALRADLCAQHPFSEEFDYGEDFEWTFWALAQGYSFVYDPNNTVFHEHDRAECASGDALKEPVARMIQLLMRDYPEYTQQFGDLYESLAKRYFSAKSQPTAVA